MSCKGRVKIYRYPGRDHRQGAKTFFERKLGGRRLFFQKKLRGRDFFSKTIRGAKSFFTNARNSYLWSPKGIYWDYAQLYFHLEIKMVPNEIWQKWPIPPTPTAISLSEVLHTSLTPPSPSFVWCFDCFRFFFSCFSSFWLISNAAISIAFTNEVHWSTEA